jgi:FkbM family methyltransferase
VTYGDHWPPPDLHPLRLIVDLGANIGAAMALFAHAFPSARIIGVEPDPSNAALCRRNVEPWETRCEVVEAAAWPDEGNIRLTGEASSAFKVDTGAGGREVPAVSLTTLLQRYAADEAVDYLKMDVEGTERELLSRGTGWIERVRCVSVEVHEPYRTEQCIEDLEQLGFYVRTKRAPRTPRVIGLRDGA